MKPTALFCLFAGLALSALAGCEEKLTVETAIAPPAPPACDPLSPRADAEVIPVDLSRVLIPRVDFQVTNEYAHKAIHVDGYELYTLIPGMGAVGGTEYIELTSTIDGGKSRTLTAAVMSESTVNMLQNAFGCMPMNDAALDDLGRSIMAGDDTLLPSLEEGWETMPAQMYAIIVFLGHTAHGKNVQSEEFSLLLETRCGPSSGWAECFDDPCFALCDGNPAPSPCQPGMNAPERCNDILTGRGRDDPLSGGDYCLSNCF